jgi:hypothetical protein
VPALAKRMQVKPGQRVPAVGAPEDYAALLGDLPEGARVVTRGDPARADHVHFEPVAEAGRRGERRTP